MGRKDSKGKKPVPPAGEGSEEAQGHHQGESSQSAAITGAIKQQIAEAFEALLPSIVNHVTNTLEARKAKKKSLKKRPLPEDEGSTDQSELSREEIEKKKNKKRSGANAPGGDPDDDPDDDSDEDSEDGNASRGSSDGPEGAASDDESDDSADLPEIPGFGRSSAPRVGRGRAVYEILPNLDSIRDSTSRAQRLKPLTGLVGKERVADYLYYLEKLVKQVVESSVIVAGTTWAVIEGNKDPTKDKPLAVALPKASSYKELVSARDSIIEMVKDRALIDSESRKKKATKRYLPMVLTQRTVELIIAAGRFSCAFDQSAWAQLCQGDTSLEEHQQSLLRILSSRRNETLSVKWIYLFLRDVRDKMAIAVSHAIREGNEQNKLMRKARQSTAGGGFADLAKVLTAALAENKGAQGRMLKGGKGKLAWEDEARAAFQHNANPAQEAAAAAAQNAAARGKAKNKEVLEAMPEDPEIRKGILRDTVCKFYWEPKLTCSRKHCRFAHVSIDETRKLGIDDSEVKAALHQELKG